MQLIPYSLEDDPAIHALRAEGAADPDVLGIMVTGSRAVGAVTTESDYDVIFIVSDETKARYVREHHEPQRGCTADPPINTTDIWHECPQTLRSYNTFAVDVCRVVYERTGELTAMCEELSRMPEEQAREAAATWYDGYLNGMYRSLKCWRVGNTLGGRLEAAQTVDALLHMLFALECYWRPFSSRLDPHLEQLATQGWQLGELRASLLDLITTGDPHRQQALARRVIALMAERGYSQVYESWNGKIDRVLAWSF